MAADGTAVPASGLGFARAQVHHASGSALATPLSPGAMNVAMETIGAPGEGFSSNLDGHREKLIASKKMEGEESLEEWQQGDPGQGGQGQGGLGVGGLGQGEPGQGGPDQGKPGQGGPGQGGPGQGGPEQGGPDGPESANLALAGDDAHSAAVRIIGLLALHMYCVVHALHTHECFCVNHVFYCLLSPGLARWRGQAGEV